ncbi:putative GMC oxidoreductase [Hypoxylon trugodes]|uniref:putative GMC oxidoreductase n=1 Tax=Hypoxylon trugodes TaxID=326681 RepID=UPI00219BB40C|nr:putative GMC oxidoreductase [Hypoxylon trugodes]KAI1385539.1 putative GMC oxidoreductase [Hypoxylon trugodes]
MWPFSPYPEHAPSEVNGKEYDYIIVGGGTAGCVLASRLSEDPHVSVLVLDKGHVKDNMISRIPLVSQNLHMSDPLQIRADRWSEPIPGVNGRKTHLWGVEGIGGNSRVNAMLWTRGSPGDYAAWSEMGFGDWGWEQVEPYFRKIENAVSHPNSKSRGHNGKSRKPFALDLFNYVKIPASSNGAPSIIAKASEKAGLPISQDCNDPSAPAMGYFYLDATIKERGERNSAYKTYLSRDVALQRRGRLTVCTGTVASHLELNAQTGVVSGVHIRSSEKQGKDQGREYFVKAKREVILCSGALCRPQLLMLSGIEPKGTAENLGIPLVKELPAVGATLSDHYSFPVQLEVPKEETLHILESVWAIWYFLLWISFGKGLMAYTCCLGTIFLQTRAIDRKTMQIQARDENGADNQDASQSRNVPDIEIMILPSHCLEPAVPGHTFFTLYPTVVQPYGTGHIELVGKDPLTHPRVTHPLFSDERDVAVARIANSGYPYPAPIGFAPGNNPDLLNEWEELYKASKTIPDAEPRKGAEKIVKLSGNGGRNKTWKNVTDDEIDDYTRRISQTSLHYSRTCPMSKDEKTGVVDQQLRVHGFKNLRIADASVFPRITSGHTMAPTIMVAERCADFVKGFWGRQKSE